MVERTGKGSPQPAPAEPSGSIADLAARDLEARSKTTGELAAEFQAAVKGSGAFSWIGVNVRQVTDHGVPAIDVYLAERVDRTAAAEEREADVVDAFDDLALSLEPSLSSHLYLIAEGVVPRLRQELEGGQADLQTHQLEFEEQIPQAT